MTNPEPGTEEGRISSIADLRAEQERQSGILDRILGILDKPGTEGESTVTSADPAPAADMAEQMRQAVRDVHAERDQAASKEEPKPEMPPREAGQPAKQRLARVLYGKEPRS